MSDYEAASSPEELESAKREFREATERFMKQLESNPSADMYRKAAAVLDQAAMAVAPIPAKDPPTITGQTPSARPIYVPGRVSTAVNCPKCKQSLMIDLS